MWNRVEVKARGKESFKRSYWKSVLVALIYMIFFGASGSAVSSNRQRISEEMSNDPNFGAIVAIILAIFGLALVISALIRIFVYDPLEVGCNRFFLVNQDSDADFGELGYSFKHNYMSAVGGMFLKDLIIFIGFILLFIPGCIFFYAFRMVPFILSEDPRCPAMEALKRSSAMMRGNKWRAFVYDLSFIGWEILSALTCGILAIFYVNPYKHNSDAALYQAIRDESNIQ